MTNKLVVIINSLKISKVKKILLYEIKFLVPNYSCLQNPLLGGYRPQIPVLSVFCPQLNLLTPQSEKITGYATATNVTPLGAGVSPCSCYVVGQPSGTALSVSRSLSMHITGMSYTSSSFDGPATELL